MVHRKWHEVTSLLMWQCHTVFMMSPICLLCYITKECLDLFKVEKTVPVWCLLVCDMPVYWKAFWSYCIPVRKHIFWHLMNAQVCIPCPGLSVHLHIWHNLSGTNMRLFSPSSGVIGVINASKSQAIWSSTCAPTLGRNRTDVNSVDEPLCQQEY